VRGFGDLLNNPALKAVVPSDLGDSLNALNATGLLSGRALAIRQASVLYDCGDVVDAAAKAACQAMLGQTAQAQALQNDTLALLDVRTVQIDALRAAINTTQDPKAIAELQARLEAEQAQAANDQSKVVLAQAMLAASREAAVQAQTERVQALMATGKTSVLNGFSFAALGRPKSGASAPAQVLEQ
jgi:type IV secretion system protein VirB5